MLLGGGQIVIGDLVQPCPQAWMTFEDLLQTRNRKLAENGLGVGFDRIGISAARR